MKNIVICTNPYRDDGMRMTLRIKKLLEEKGVSPKFSLLFEPETKMDCPEEIALCPLDEALKNADVLVCLGGDGTILHTAKNAAISGVPILGINTGRMGFIADLEAEDYERIVEIVDGEYSIESRMMIDVSVERGGETIYSDFALNEVVIKEVDASTVDVSVYGDDKKMSSFIGDGVILATPTGSTAYCMSAGGPIVEPTAKNIIITPICAHELGARSFVLSPDRHANVIIESGEDKNVKISVDGRMSPKLKGGDMIKVCRSGYETRLVRVRNRSFYEIVNAKLYARDL